MKFGIVTPSLDNAQFLLPALRSVADQKCDDAIEHIVMDGGSRDGSQEILSQHAQSVQGQGNVTFLWTDEPDNGQADAIAKGFAALSDDVEIMAWLNSDDIYMPWAFAALSEIFRKHPEVEWISSVHPMTIDEHGNVIGCDVRWGYSGAAFRRGEHLPGGKWASRWFIQQDCTFWRRSLWEKSGGFLNMNHDLAFDFELWLRFFDHAQLYSLATPLSGFRVHDNQKTVIQNTYIAEAHRVLTERGHALGQGATSFLRKHLAYPTRFVPVNELLASIGLLERVTTFKHSGRSGKWEPWTKFI